MNRHQAHILALLQKADAAGLLSEDGPTSLFYVPKGSAPGRRPTQLAVRVQGELITVRQTRLPFIKPLTFALRDVRAHAPQEDAP